MDTPYPVAFPFHAMAQSGNKEGLQALLKQVGPEHAPTILNSIDNRGFTVLHKSIESGNEELIQHLLEEGADIHAEVSGNDPNGWTALHLAAFFDLPEVLSLLVERGAQVNHSGGSTCFTPLKVAVTRGSAQCAELLIASGADAMITDSSGFSLLHEAANIGSVEMVNILINAGCKKNTQANDGSTPAMWANQHDNLELSNLLK
jgi:ankyrin repeat protein